MKKRTFAALVLLVFMLCLLPAPALADAQRVHDDAGLLDVGQIAELEHYAKRMREEYATDMVILTTTDTQGKATNVYCADYFEAIGAGVGETRDGVLLCIDMQNREIMLVTHGSAVAAITAEREELVYDAMYNAVVDGDYAGAFMEGMRTVEDMLAEGPPHGQFTYNTQTGEITGFYYPEDAQSVLQNGIAEGYMTYDQATNTYYYHPEGVPAPPLLSKERLARAFQPGYLGLSALVGALSGLFSRGQVKRGYNKPFDAAVYSFRDNSGVKMSAGNDALINKFVTTRIIPRVDNFEGRGGGGGGFSGGSGTFSSSSGGSFGGGGGRKF